MKILKTLFKLIGNTKHLFTTKLTYKRKIVKLKVILLAEILFTTVNNRVKEYSPYVTGKKLTHSDWLKRNIAYESLTRVKPELWGMSWI